MTRVDVSESWTAAGSVNTTQVELNKFLRAWGMRVVGEQPGEVHARQGRWLGRLLGTRLAPAAWLPALAVVRFERGGGRLAVRATIGEASTAASLDPRVEAKFQDHFARWMAALRARLA
jgi:hypothetical protein